MAETGFLGLSSSQHSPAREDCSFVGLIVGGILSGGPLAVNGKTSAGEFYALSRPSDLLPGLDLEMGLQKLSSTMARNAYAVSGL
jgi:hypothetical protein